MSRHRLKTGWLVRRSAYRELWLRYQALLADHRALEQDHALVLADHEGLLFEQEALAPVPHQTQWGLRNQEAEQTVELPVPGMDLEKTEALVRRADLLDGPAGHWGVTGPETG